MKKLMRKAMVAVGLAGLTLTVAQAALVSVPLPTLTFNTLGVSSGNPYVFDSSHQPYLDLVTGQGPPAGARLATGIGHDAPKAEIVGTPSDSNTNGVSGASGGAALNFFTDLTITASQLADGIAKLQFLYFGSVEVVDDANNLSNVFDCTFGFWCDSRSIDLSGSSMSKVITFRAFGGTIDDVSLTIIHETNGGTAPEPTSGALTLLALTGAGAAWRRRKIDTASR